MPGDHDDRAVDRAIDMDTSIDTDTDTDTVPTESRNATPALKRPDEVPEEDVQSLQTKCKKSRRFVSCNLFLIHLQNNL